jgi:Asp-tRNA(Asn)/Glu-tRNA(Gln) amidotransferase A subunit family amidase
LFNSMDVPGILARTVGDCRSVFGMLLAASNYLVNSFHRSFIG